MPKASKAGSRYKIGTKTFGSRLMITPTGVLLLRLLVMVMVMTMMMTTTMMTMPLSLLSSSAAAAAVVMEDEDDEQQRRYLPLTAAVRSSCSKAEAIRSISALLNPSLPASLRHPETASPTSRASARASFAVNSKYAATS